MNGILVEEGVSIKDRVKPKTINKLIEIGYNIKIFGFLLFDVRRM